MLDLNTIQFNTNPPDAELNHRRLITRTLFAHKLQAVPDLMQLVLHAPLENFKPYAGKIAEIKFVSK